MIVPATVELTKIHFYDQKIAFVSREIFQNEINRKIVVEKNCFGHRWILKINEIGGGRAKLQWRIICVVSVFLVTIILALIFLLLKPEQASVPVVPTLNITNVNVKSKICADCIDICLKLTETGNPQCVKALDTKDPTGCGGFCILNTQFCQLLDPKNRVFQCSNLKNTLKCPFSFFNCGNMCVSGDKKCDGKIHCSNRSDEKNCSCDLQTHFHCGNMTSCLPKIKKCDGMVDCWDKSDEINCQKHCETGTVPCITGGCIPRENLCDGKIHCPDRSDEPEWCQ